MLAALGLDEATESVYLTMLEHSDWGVLELGENLGLSEKQIRGSLDRLFELTLVTESLQNPGELRAVGPEVGLQSLLARQQAQLLQRQQEVACTQAAVVEMIAQFGDLGLGSVRASTVRLMGMDKVMDQLSVLARQVSREVLAFVPGGAQLPQALAEARRHDSELLARGVVIRTIYQDSVRNDPLTLAYAEWLTESGGEVRTLPVLPPRMLLFDRMIALVPLDPESTQTGALQTSEPGMISSLLVLFEQTWATARIFGAARERQPDGLLDSERELLKLVAQGLTDEAAAKRLGVSPRTARRTMAGLMERLDARSRFAAGLRAAQLGWLLAPGERTAASTREEHRLRPRSSRS